MLGGCGDLARKSLENGNFRYSEGLGNIARTKRAMDCDHLHGLSHFATAFPLTLAQQA